jgi:DNA invertase Pin-like site-specific DNA recombinase
MDTNTPPARRLGYARVSTDEQDEALQVAALESAGIDALFIDRGVSGAKTSRPRLDAMLEQASTGDTVVVYSLSRLSRGMTHLLELSETFECDGIGLVSLTEQIDTASATGRFTFRLLAALAAMERTSSTMRSIRRGTPWHAVGPVAGRPPELRADGGGP